MPRTRVDRTRLLLHFTLPAGKSRVAIDARLHADLRRVGLYLEGTAKRESLRDVHHTSTDLWVRDRKRKAISPDRVARLAGVFGPRLRWVAPVERQGTELLAPLADALVVRPRAGVDAGLLARAFEAQGLTESVERSKLLGAWRYFVVRNPSEVPAPVLADRLRKALGRLVDRIHVEYMAHRSPLQLEPNDTFYSRQWAPPHLGAPAAWDIATGSGIIVAVIDSGCELAHSDLPFSDRGMNLDLMRPDALPTGANEWERAHGTLVAGVIGARLNNLFGVAGIAGHCRIYPLAAERFTHAVVAMGIRLSVSHGARVINMSVETPTFMFETSPVRDAIDDAVAAGAVLCASTGNGNGAFVIYPAKHPDVVACGGSTEADARWVSTSTLGSNYGDAVALGRPSGVDVVAPALNIFSTDLIGPAGVAPGASPFGDLGHFNATSAAAPHASGLAALLLSLDDTLTPAAVRRIINRTAEKVGGYRYADADGYPDGTRHPEMGYGRLHLHRALDLGDAMIRDWPDDDGVEPSTPPGGVFWTTSDIVIRPTDDGVFEPTNPGLASELVRGSDHSIYVRVRNTGPSPARNVHVEARVTPWVGLEFVYPEDWRHEASDDAFHLRPAPVTADFATVPVGGEVQATFRLSAAEADVAAGWTAMSWHPCLLAEVTADNDYAFQTSASGSGLQTRRNNLAQRNLTVVTMAERRSARWPFVIGHPTDRDRLVELVIDAADFAPGGRVALSLDDDGKAFPALWRAQAYAGGRLEVGKLSGAVLHKLGRGRIVVPTSPRAVVQLRLPAAGRYPLSLSVRPPRSATRRQRLTVDVAQRSPKRGVVGGASLVYNVR